MSFQQGAGKSFEVIQVQDGLANSAATSADLGVPIDDHVDTNVEANVSMEKVIWLGELVSKIMTYLPTLDLKSCNGVCHLWRHEARKLLLKRTRMDFFGGSGLAPNLQTQVESYMVEMGDNCHQHIRIHNLEDNNAERTAMGELGYKYGSQIRYLSLRRVRSAEILGSFPYVSTLSVMVDRNTGFIRIPDDLIMPSVTTLRLKVWKLCTWNEFEILPAMNLTGTEDERSVRCLLQMCPKIENLYLEGYEKHPYLKLFQQVIPQTNDYRWAFQMPRTLVYRTISGINFIRCKSSPQLGFSSAQLTMLEIDFHLVIPDANPPSFALLQLQLQLQQVLRTCSPTLKQLKLYRIPSYKYGLPVRHPPVYFPAMLNLVSLEITHFDDAPHRKYVPLFNFMIGDGSSNSIDYTKQFPVLKKLNIKPAYGLGDADESNLDGSFLLFKMFYPDWSPPCYSLTSVDVYFISWITTHRDDFGHILKKFVGMFPNVVELKRCMGRQ